MPDVTVKSIDDMEAIYGGLARRARAELGVTAWGMQVFTLPPDWDGYPNHNHSSEAFDPNQEEVYIPLSGAATLVADGSAFELGPGTMVRVGTGSVSWRSAAHPAPSRPALGRSSVRIRPARRPGSVSQAMDEQAFALLIEPHRRALHLHCYRMLGSLHDADDALQETMLRAWKGSDRYEPRAQLTTWLHAIATNVCLSAIARRRARPAELSEDLEHLQPYPDRLLEDLVVRETVELAFITAIQLLPPKQRAVLILRDVLGWSAKEAAAALDDSVAAVTSALQRARVSLGETRRHVPAPGARERALVKRFMTAWDAVDIDGLVALLSEDALMTMPPERMRVAGARAIGDFFGSVPQGGRLDEIRLLPTSANRQPALAAYARGDDGKHRPYGLMVLQTEGDLIAGIVGFPDPWLFEQCGLPSELT